ncbi:ESX secretion-associated protein EspG [Antrihabitans sp. YC2-6]|uniref:ESX secretion-associated protein EspG n=1 Tax=Antrihabitans sp. YC2-6 TaxID=2799498 RepID=UPI0018F7113D|nr:ESX secretion-associated protein EspG [Antrihabitans sp. YC2-6]MBJ8343298.1 ESX secretion-associated protein EspG [Antrihabitans sp. YC2-6]
MPAWELSADHFAAVWYGRAHDRLPFPFRLLSRFRYADEYDAFASRVRADLTDDQPLREALRVLADPEIRVEVFGLHGPDLATELRVIGCARSGAGVVATQTPGLDGGTVALRTCAAGALAERVLDRLPEATMGSAKPQRFPVDSLAAAAPGAYVRRADAVSHREQFRKIARSPRSAQGTVSIFAGVRTEEQRARTGVVRWFDVVGDGRYTEVRTRSHVEVEPAGRTQIIGKISSFADQAMAVASSGCQLRPS